MELDLRAYLLAQPAIADLVADRIHWRASPLGLRLPRITLRIVAGTSVHSQAGPSGLLRYRVQVSCFAPGVDTLAKLRDSVCAAMDGLRGRQGETVIRDCSYLAEVDLPEPPRHGKDAEICHRAIDFEIWVRGQKTRPRAHP